MNHFNGPLRIGIGGPVGTGKTALMDALCRAFRDRYQVAAITNDIYTKEDAEFLTRAGSLPATRYRARAGPASPGAIFWSSTRSTSLRWSAPVWR